MPVAPLPPGLDAMLVVTVFVVAVLLAVLVVVLAIAGGVSVGCAP